MIDIAREALSPLAPSPVRKFRLLRVGEIPQKGDQFLKFFPARWVRLSEKHRLNLTLAGKPLPVPSHHKGRYRRRFPNGQGRQSQPGGEHGSK